jgi:hypothetical protein
LKLNPEKSFQRFSPCYSQSLLQLCFEIYISSNSCNLLHISTVQLLHTVKEKGENPDRKPYPLPYSLRKQYRNLMSENFQYFAQKTQRKCTFMNSAYSICRSVEKQIQKGCDKKRDATYIIGRYRP